MAPDNFPPTPRGKERRATLLQAAESVFGDKGYAQTTIADISRKAQAAQGTFYIYFNSKAHIFTELVSDIGSGLRRALAEACANSPNRLEAERAGLAAFLAILRDRPAIFSIVEEARLVAPKAYRAFYEDLARSYAGRLQDAQNSGQIAVGNVDVAAWALIGLSRTLGERYALWEDVSNHEDVVNEAVAFIRDGMGPH